MTAKKITSFINRQQTKPRPARVGSIRFSSLDDDKEEDEIEGFISLGSSPNKSEVLSSSKENNPTLVPGASRKSSLTTRPASESLPSRLSDFPATMSSNSNQVKSVNITETGVNLDSSTSTNVTLPANSFVTSAPLQNTESVTHTAPPLQATSAVKGASSDVSAEEIFAILDTFQRDPSKKERRKPSDLVKNKTASSISTSAYQGTQRSGFSLDLIRDTPPPIPDVDKVQGDDGQDESSSTVRQRGPSFKSLLESNISPTLTVATTPPTAHKMRAMTISPVGSEVVSSSKDTTNRESRSVNSSPASQRKTLDGGQLGKLPEPVQNNSFATPILESTDKKHSETPVKSSHRRSRRSKDKSSEIKYKVLGVAVVVLVILYILPISSFALGVVCGALLSLALCRLYLFLSRPSTVPPGQEPRIPSLRDLPPPRLPEIQEDANMARVQRGWMNELIVYNPDTFHLNKTHSIMVTLEGTQLRLQRPKQNIPRRAMFNEPTGRPTTFGHQRIYNMLHARVSLVPKGLVKKRVWSKKYPICVVVNRSSKVSASSLVVSKSASTPNLNPKSTVDLGFEVIGQAEIQEETLFLFARTSREKEEWFGRFQAASLGVPLPTSLKHLVKTYLSESEEPGSSSSSSSSPPGTPGEGTGEKRTAHEPLLVTYTRYMAKFMPEDWLLQAAKERSLSVNYVTCDPPFLWLNALFGRMFWDFLREASWVSQIRDKIQNKLKKLHLPYFIDELIVVDIDLGNELPVIRRAGKPYLNQRGFWVDFEIAYTGGFVMALETKVNLLKLKEKPRHSEGKTRSGEDVANEPRQCRECIPGTTAACSHQPEVHTPTKGSSVCSSTTSLDGSLLAPAAVDENGPRGRLSAAYTEEEEDSAESSTDSEGEELTAAQLDEMDSDRTGASGGPSRRLFRLVDRISRSRYFHKALDNKYIQKGMEYVSNTRLVLQVEVQLLSGTLAVNIPPPPSDRLWYGFRTNPVLKLNARPRVGSKEVTMSKITEWIEHKLALEFQRVVVMPNMDDIIIPLLCSGSPENYGHNLH